MNIYQQERINMIILMAMYIIGLPRPLISRCVQSTQIYVGIQRENETILYDGYSANLAEMVDEWKTRKRIPYKLLAISKRRHTAQGRGVPVFNLPSPKNIYKTEQNKNASMIVTGHLATTPAKSKFSNQKISNRNIKIFK